MTVVNYPVWTQPKLFPQKGALGETSSVTAPNVLYLESVEPSKLALNSFI